MIAVDDALALIRAQVRPLPVERVPVDAALGRVLAEDAVAVSDLPPFDNSAMDGYALPRDAVAGSIWRVDAEAAAGDAPGVATDAACRIMTGAPIPVGAMAVVPVEDTEVIAMAPDGSASAIRLIRDIVAGQHVRRAGQDVRLGTAVVAAGRRIGAAETMVLRGVGRADVAVRRAPRIALACTGRELVDDVREPLRPGRIYNSNGPYLAIEWARAGGECVERRTVDDAPDRFKTLMQEWMARDIDLIVTTGAVSMGRYDFVPDVLAALGAELLFHKVAMRPGKPLLCARLSNGALCFGLPGNPVSSAVGARFFVGAAIRASLGLPPEQPWRLPLLHDVRKTTGFRLFQKAALEVDGEARIGVRLLAGQESFRTEPLLHSHAWAVLPEAADTLAAGESVAVWPPCHFDAPFAFRS